MDSEVQGGTCTPSRTADRRRVWGTLSKRTLRSTVHTVSRATRWARRSLTLPSTATQATRSLLPIVAVPTAPVLGVTRSGSLRHIHGYVHLLLPLSVSLDERCVPVVLTIAQDLIAARKAGFKTAYIDFEEHDPVTSVFGEFDLYASTMEDLLTRMHALE